MTTPNLDAWSAAQENRDFFADLTAEQIRDMPMSAFAARTSRPSPGRIAADATRYASEAAQSAAEARSGAPTGNLLPSNSVAPAAPPSPAQGRPFEELANESGEQGFLSWRSQRRSSGEGVGIMDSVSSTSQAYREAAAQHAGRTGYRQGTSDGAELMARRGRAIVKRDELTQYKNASDRFRLPGSAYNG